MPKKIKILACMFFLFFVISINFANSAEKKKASFTQVEELMNAVLNDPATYFAIYHEELKKIPKKLFVADSFIEWSNYSVDFPEDMLPKNDAERKKLLEDEHHPYHVSYVFSPLKCDSFFSSEDRLVISEQYKSSLNKPWTLKRKDLKVIEVKNKKKLPVHFRFTYPLFSKDGKRAVIRKYTYHYWLNDETGWIRDMETFYYEHTPSEGWKIYHKSGIWDC